MTSEEKAMAWKLAADELEYRLNAVEKRFDPDGVTSHIRDVIIPHLRKRAERIRSSSKARREMEEA